MGESRKPSLRVEFDSSLRAVYRRSGYQSYCRTLRKYRENWGNDSIGKGTEGGFRDGDEPEKA